ncbi:hypothetical protein C5167_028545 [Papaver somniferum]|nr:hypothetical protein C5167_028545 [Papaver somniferum]
MNFGYGLIKVFDLIDDVIQIFGSVGRRREDWNDDLAKKMDSSLARKRSLMGFWSSNAGSISRPQKMETGTVVQLRSRIPPLLLNFRWILSLQDNLEILGNLSFGNYFKTQSRDS